MHNAGHEILLDLLKSLGFHVCQTLRNQLKDSSIETLAAVTREAEDDTIYAIDDAAEKLILDHLNENKHSVPSFFLIMEGGSPDGFVFASSGRKSDCEYTVIMDPLDGTRGLMYGKRSAWLLAGAAPGTSDSLTLQDISLAVQTEIPPPKQNVIDRLWSIAGTGAFAESINLDSGYVSSFIPKPSRARNLNYGFATFNRFFPGAKDVITAIETSLQSRLETTNEPAFHFEDQHICNGGQLAALATGRDRFVCDIRAELSPLLEAAGRPPLLCAHPYDLCCELIAREAGVIVTAANGLPLKYPLDTTTDVSWVAYANDHIRTLVEPFLLDLLNNLEEYVQ